MIDILFQLLQHVNNRYTVIWDLNVTLYQRKVVLHVSAVTKFLKLYGIFMNTERFNMVRLYLFLEQEKLVNKKLNI